MLLPCAITRTYMVSFCAITHDFPHIRYLEALLSFASVYPLSQPHTISVTTEFNKAWPLVVYFTIDQPKSARLHYNRAESVTMWSLKPEWYPGQITSNHKTSTAAYLFCQYSNVLQPISIILCLVRVWTQYFTDLSVAFTHLAFNEAILQDTQSELLGRRSSSAGRHKINTLTNGTKSLSWHFYDWLYNILYLWQVWWYTSHETDKWCERILLAHLWCTLQSTVSLTMANIVHTATLEGWTMHHWSLLGTDAAQRFMDVFLNSADWVH